MKSNSLTTGLATFGGSALVGGLFGILIVSLGSVIAAGPLTVGASIAIASILGGWLGEWTGAFVGGLYGALIASFGSVIGGSPLGAELTILACTVMGGYLGARSSEQKLNQADTSRYQSEDVLLARYRFANLDLQHSGLSWVDGRTMPRDGRESRWSRRLMSRRVPGTKWTSIIAR